MRVCIFCPNRASTKEDAWPLWLMRLLFGGASGTIEGERSSHPVGPWRAVRPGLKVKVVCARCNNGWMSELENRVKPIVETLCREESAALSAADQETLAVWSVKTAMVFEAFRLGRPPFFAQSERHLVRETLRPAPNTSVWAAKCVESPGAFCAASDLGGVVEDSTEGVRAYVTTMGFGPLALQVVGTRLPTTIPPSVMSVTADLRPGPWDDATIRIWPTQRADVTWPGSVGLRGAAGLEAFSERWSPPAGV